MLNLNQLDNTNTVEIIVDGNVTREEFDNIISQLELLIEKHGKIKIIEIIKNLGKIELSAIWEDFKFAPKHLKDLTHVAVVADQQWIEWMSKLANPLIKAEVKTYTLDQVDEARHWINRV